MRRVIQPQSERVRNQKPYIAVGVIAALGFSASAAFAGNGKILPPDNAPSRANRIELEVFVAGPVGQSQLDLLKQQVFATNRTLCDATDGNFRISQVTVTQGAGKQASGDVWWYPNSGRATADLGKFGSGAGAHVLMYGFENDRLKTGMYGNTLAHELGHHIFGLLDQYPEDTNSCPQGPSFDGPEQLSENVNSFAVGPWFRDVFGRPFFQQQQSTFPAMVDTTVNNSLMQQSMSQVCVGSNMASTSFGMAHNEVSPLFQGQGICLTTTDCTNNYGGNFTCQTPDSSVPAFDTVKRSSEFSVRTNYDPTRATVINNAPPAEGVAARELVLQGILNGTGAPECVNNSAVPPHPELGQNCGFSSGGSLSCLPFTSGVTTGTCLRCMNEKSTCVPAPVTCGNGVVDAGEECDAPVATALAACSTLGLLGSSTHCGSNCLLDLSKCSPTLTAPLDVTSLAAAAASSNFWSAAYAYDVNGVVQGGGSASALSNGTNLTPLNFDQLGKSVHAVYVFGKLQGRFFEEPTTQFGRVTGVHEQWQFVFAADGAEFGAGAPAGTFVELGRYKVDLIDKAYATSKNLTAVTVDGPAQLFLGFAAAQPGQPAGTAPTGTFKRNGTATLTLAPKFDSLQLLESFGVATLPTARADHRWSQGVLYARNGVLNGREVPQYAKCSDAAVAKLTYNMTTQRYEASNQSRYILHRALNGADLQIPGLPKLSPADVATNQQLVASGNEAALAPLYLSDWEILAAGMTARGVLINPPVGTPLARFDVTDADMDLIPDQCPNPTFTAFSPNLPGANDQVVLVLDRSGSMNTKDAPGATNLVGLQRLDFAKASAESFIRLLDRASEPQFGLVWFSTTPETKVGGMTALRHLVAGVKADDPVMDQVGVDTIISDFLKPSSSPPETPVPEGATGTAAALQAAGTLFEPANGGTRMIVLLTDGFANVPLAGAPGGLPGLGAPSPATIQKALDDVKTVTAQLATQGIVVETITTGTDGSGTMPQEIATATGGSAVTVPRSQEIAPSFLEVYGKLRGEQLVRSHRDLPRLGTVSSRVVPVHDIPVESGAQELTVLMSDNQTSCSTTPSCPYLRNPTLTAPNGTLVAPTVVAGRYSLWRIPTPGVGTWQLADLSEGAQWPAGSEARSWNSFVSALVRNPEPKCLANISKQIVNDDSSVTVSVTAFSGQPLATGVNVTGYMLRPDQVQVPLTFTQPALGFARQTTISPSQFVGKGVYIVTARCEVAAGAQRDAGENLPSYRDQDPIPPLTQNAQPFVREVTKGFLVQSNTLPGLPGTVPLAPGQIDRGGALWGDGDNDHIPNGAEPSGDYDQDGTPNDRDSDADGDDVPDAIDTSIVPRPVGNYERWDNVTGTAVSAIPFNRDPDFVSSLTTLEAPTNVGDNFGARISGLIAPTVTGNYTFFISGDANVALYLSTTTDQANKVRIAYHTSSTNVREWTKFPTQKSAPIALEAGKYYYIEAQQKESTGTDHMAVGWLKPGQSGSVPSEVTPLPFPATPLPKGDGSIGYERWNNVAGQNVVDIPLTTTPNVTQSRTELRAPSNAAESYGVRMRGWVTAPSTGNYTFWISGDDHVALYLSRSGLAGTKELIAFHDGYTGELEWNKYPSQRSAAISLVAGRRYYIEALLKEESGTDNLAVGWLKPGESGSAPSEVIPGRQLSPYVAPPVPPGQTACISQALPRASASATSQESSTLAASKAIDGNLATRWGSLFSNPQSLTVDLGQLQLVSRVKLSWENAASADYDVQVSTDNVTWRTVYTDAHANGGTDDITGLAARARYVRMFSRARTSPYGNSLWEMEVFGDPNEDCFAVLGERFEAKPEATEQEGGCHVSRPGSTSSNPLWLMLGLAALAVPLRRRSLRSTQRPWRSGR